MVAAGFENKSGSFLEKKLFAGWMADLFIESYSFLN
jgi:hypothetical protein